VEAAWEMADGKIILLVLDWAEVFDSVSPRALSNALRRFGLPQAFISMVDGIYVDRKFFVRTAGVDSNVKTQAFGISQGCPLSPFLFVIMMTVLMHDANRMVSEKFGHAAAPYLVSRTLLYADDTLIKESDARVVQYFMDSIAEIGAQYGMQYNWTKLEALRVRHDGHIDLPDGTHVKEKESMIYLSGILSADGRVEAELSRRLGMANADFAKLKAVWSHANISQQRKVVTYKACVIQKLLYCLDTTWLNTKSLRKLDGFHARCLRKIHGLPHSYVSRISNVDVLKRAGCHTLSSTLRERQLKLLGKIARMNDDAPQKKMVFEPGGQEIRRWPGVRRRGRPRQTWAPCVWEHAIAAAGDEAALATLLQNPQAWNLKVRRYCYDGQPAS